MSQIKKDRREALKRRWELRMDSEGKNGTEFEDTQMELARIGFRMKKMKAAKNRRQWKIWEDELHEAWTW